MKVKFFTSRPQILLLFVAMLLFSAKDAIGADKKSKDASGSIFRAVGNPYLPLWEIGRASCRERV